MITFGQCGLSTESTKSGRSLCYVEIIYNGETYLWQVYIPNGVDVGSYLNDNATIYENDIIRKEVIWSTTPRTKIETDMFGNTIEVPVLKSDIVKPTIPDYEETISDPTFDIKAIKRLLILLTKDLLKSPQITQEHIDDLTLILPYYEVGKHYLSGDTFSFESKLYEVIQTHTSQADWYPPTTPALYKIKTPAGMISQWVQPLGAQDAYKIGDKVLHNGFTWLSTNNSNVWEPGGVGTESLWKKI